MTAPEFYTTATGHRAYGVPGPGEAAQQAAAAVEIATVLANLRDTAPESAFTCSVMRVLGEQIDRFRPRTYPEAEPGFWDNDDIRARMM